MISNRKNSKGSVQIFLTIAIMAAILGALGYFAFISEKRVIPEEGRISASPTLTPTPGIDETENWKTYTNDKYGFTVKYYPESPPEEITGTDEAGQFTFIYKVNFGTNPIKFPFGYELAIRLPRSIEDYRIELVGHITDQVDSVEKTEINNIKWTKINYRIFLTADFVPITMAYVNKDKYDYTITTPSQGIDQILSTFKFTDSQEKGKSCIHNGKTYKDGEGFMDKCNSCSCLDGQVACTLMACPN